MLVLKDDVAYEPVGQILTICWWTNQLVDPIGTDRVRVGSTHTLPTNMLDGSVYIDRFC
jgi:hypothetical protein